MSNAITIEIPTNKTSVVALKTGGKHKVVSHGTKVSTVVKKAEKSGDDDAIIMFVPKKGQRYIY